MLEGTWGWVWTTGGQEKWMKSRAIISANAGSEDKAEGFRAKQSSTLDSSTRAHRSDGNLAETWISPF